MEEREIKLSYYPNPGILKNYGDTKSFTVLRMSNRGQILNQIRFYNYAEGRQVFDDLDPASGEYLLFVFVPDDTDGQAAMPITTIAKKS